MNDGKLSVNRACLIGIVVLSSIGTFFLIAAFLLTKNLTIVGLGLLFFLLVFICITLFVVFLRQKLVLFSDSLCKTIDNMLNGVSSSPQVYEEESLFYKINHRLVRLYEVMQENRVHIGKERGDLQELISDISHQVKTPISNLKMVNATLIEHPMSKEK